MEVTADMGENNEKHPSPFRYLLVWVLGVLQVLTTTAVIAAAGALWTLSTGVTTLAVEIVNIKADVIAVKLRQEKSDAEVKRVSDEQIRRGVIIEQLRSKK